MLSKIMYCLVCIIVMMQFIGCESTGGGKESKTEINLLEKGAIPEASEWEDGRRWGAVMNYNDDGSITITGNSLTQSYGRAVKRLNFNINKFPYLKVNVVDCSRYWYVIAVSDDFPEGYIKIQRDTKGLGEQNYDLKRILDFNGFVDITLEVGVSTSEELPTNDGETVVINELKLLKSID